MFHQKWIDLSIYYLLSSLSVAVESVLLSSDVPSALTVSDCFASMDFLNIIARVWAATSSDDNWGEKREQTV